jgi:dGTPase
MTVREQFRVLLSPARLRETSIAGRDFGGEAISDKGRVVTSSPFRRLQAKAQVFSLEQNASVRTRLTHTLEVATFGEIMADQAFSALLEGGNIDEDLRLPFTKTVEVACLLHDIGNPPFGHLGEYAIQSWFKANKPIVSDFWKVKEAVFDRHYKSFEFFDGNPQGLRIVTRNQWHRDEFGLNLRAALIASTIKYLDSVTHEGVPFSSKIGFFETERDRVEQIWGLLGLRYEKDGSLQQRHPLVFLVEAADDIAYSLSDIEDAIEKAIISEKQFFDQIGERPPGLPHGKPGPSAQFIEYKINTTRNLVRRMSEVFAETIEALVDGRTTEPLLDGDKRTKDTLRLLKQFTKEHVFLSREAVDVELTGFHIVYGLLDVFSKLLALPADEFERLRENAADPPKRGQHVLEHRLFTLLSRKHVLTYEHETKQYPKLEPVMRTHLIVDYIAGMTDSHAQKVFRTLHGFSSGGAI